MTREQHITARMWLEKSQAEEDRAEGAAKVAELQGVLAQWEVRNIGLYKILFCF